MSSSALSTCSKLGALLFSAAVAFQAVAGGGSGGGGSGGGGGSTTDVDLAGEVLVKLRSSAALGPLLGRYPLTLVSRFGSRPIYRLKVIGAARVKDVLAGLTVDPEVMIAETNPTNRSPEARRNLVWAIGTPDAYTAQWAPQALRLATAHGVTRGEGVRVAVLDTGVDGSHPLLAGRLLPGFDFVDFGHDPSEQGGPANAGFGHGTHVAGLVATVAPNAKIMPIRVLDADGVGNAWVLGEAMLYAVDPDGNPATDDGAHVINMSLGSLTRTRIMATIAQIVSCIPAVPDDPIGDRSDPGYDADTARCMAGNGAVVVAAAGNDASKGVKEYPAAEGAYGLLPIAASNLSRKLASFSNSGSWIDLSAPGEGITSAMPGGGFATWSGTSMASPLAAGTAALVRSLDLGVTPKDVVRRMLRTAGNLCDSSRILMLDAAAAVMNRTPIQTECP